MNGVEVSSSNILEVTQPRVTIVLDPRVCITRFPFYNFFGPTPEHFSGRDLPNIRFSSNRENIVTYDQYGSIVMNTGITGRLEERTGVLEFGDVPGDDDITVTYDDGEWQESYTFAVRYTKLDFDVTAMGSLTEGTEDVYITEWIDFDAHVTNPFDGDFDNGHSEFIARTPIEITMDGGEEFYVAYDEYVRDGTLPPINGASKAATIVKTNRFVGYVAPHYNPAFNTFPIPHPNEGRARFSISPLRTGEVTFKVRVLNDPNIPEKTFTLNVIRPDLQMDDLNLNHPIPPNDALPAGQWLSITEVPDIPNVRALALSDLTRWADVSPPEWIVKRPDGSTKMTLATAESGTFKEFFDLPGEYRITKRLRDRPEVATNEFVFTAPDIADYGDWPTLGDNPYGNTGNQVPNSMILGGVKVLSPLRGVWKPGEPIDVILQLFDGAGNPGAIGYTRQSVEVGGPSPETFNQSWVLYPQPRRLSGPGFSTDYPEIEIPNQETEKVYMDTDGIVRFTITPFASETQPSDHSMDLILGFNYQFAQQKTLGALSGDRLFRTTFTYNTNSGTYQLTSEPAMAPPNLRSAKYEDPLNEFLYDFCIRIAGRGAVFSPRRIPIASKRVRDAIAAGTLAAGSDNIRVEVTGTEGFADALGSGFSSATVGDGLALVESQVDGEKLVLTLSSDFDYWEQTPNELKVRTIEVNFADGSQWAGEIDLFRVDLKPENENEEFDLPLNGRYGLDSELASVSYVIERIGQSIADLDLTLDPSIDASWDANRNGITDTDEDLNEDGFFDERDTASGIGTFRGRSAASPLVGFKRQGDQSNGGYQVRELTSKIAIANNAKITIYGNPTDRRTLSPSGQLSEIGEPDNLPDFVSNTINGESLAVTSGGNWVDFVQFTAYNFVTEFLPEAEPPNILFSDLKSSLNETYEKYSSFTLPY